MSTKVTINGNTYKVPDSGSPAGWGEDTTNVILDLISVVNALSGNDYISESDTVLSADADVVTDIPVLIFKKENTRSVNIEYVIKIDATTPLVESGNLRVYYDENSSDWKLERDFSGDTTNVQLSVTSNGQIQYKRPNYVGFNNAVIYYKTSSLVSVTV